MKKEDKELVVADLTERLRTAGVETYVLPLDRSVADARKDTLGTAALLRWRGLAAALSYTWRLARFVAARWDQAQKQARGGAA